MNSNNSLTEYKEGIISKIRKFFKKIFVKDNKQDNYIKESTIKKENQNIRKDEFINNIKVDSKLVNSIIQKKNLLEEINKNEEALSMLSIDRLEKLEEYYNEVIKQNNEIIKNLKQTA